MSGPKTSRYVLTKEQRRRMEEQQRIIRETKIAQDKKKRLQKKCLEQSEGLAVILEELNRLSTETGTGSEEFQVLLNEKKEIEKVFEDKSISDSLESLKMENQRLEKALAEIQKIKSKSENVRKRISSDYKRELSEVMADGFELSFAGLGQDRKIRENPFAVKIEEALASVEEMELSFELQEKLAVLKRRGNEIKDIDFLENFCSMQVYPFVQECEFYRDHMGEFEELLAEYSYLAAEAGEQARSFSFSEENISILKSERIRLGQIVMCQKEQEYINTAVDEAMIEMGYELIGERSVTKKSGRRFRSGLYVLEEGTAVNVTFSDAGQISMELGALDQSDRIPSESEAAELTDDMEAFCADYDALEKRLEEKGIVTNRVSVLPPSAEYAQVFNISEYELRSSIRAHKKEKKKAVKKQLQKER